MNYKVLIVDDEAELAEYTARYFNMSGVETAYALDAKAAEEFLKDNTCSLILLDINLGEDSGFDLCQKIRTTMDIPIFFISARLAENDMLLALSIGGDDYITKPYSLGVLLAKVRAELKRYEESRKMKNMNEETGEASNGSGAGNESIITLGKAEVNLRTATVKRGGEEYPLKAMEYKLLVYMLNNRGRVIPKDEFFEKIWGTEFVGDVTLNVHMRHLREKIEDDPGNPEIIKTVWGVGFILA